MAKKFQMRFDAKDVLAPQFKRSFPQRTWIGQVFPHLSIASQLLARLPHRKESDE